MSKSTDPVSSKQTRRIALYLFCAIFLSFSYIFYLYSNGNEQTINLNAKPGPLLNPMMGWAPWATIKESNQPHTLVYADLTWRDFEPQEGHFDFDSFEKKQQLTRWRKEGKRVVFRFVADVPGKEPHMDIPGWLFDKINGNGSYYDNEYGKGFSPDYSNRLLIEYHKKAIQALGTKYGKDDFFIFIELGSLGHWGEWHTHAEIQSLPSEEIRNIYVSHYVNAFPKTHLLMRRPFGIAQKLSLGLYNDMTAASQATTTWLDWIEHGGEYLPQEPTGLVPMPTGWQKAPIGGEQAPELSDEQVYDINLKQTLQLLKQSHTTFIGPNGPYQVKNRTSLQTGIDQVLATIGYRISVDQVQMPRQILYGRTIKIRFTFLNYGIAPMYYNWPSRAYIWDDDGTIVETHPLQIDFRNILPEKSYNVNCVLPIFDLENGTYSLGIAIVDPITGEPGVQFANENTRNDLIQYIGSFEVRRILHIKRNPY